MNFKIQRADSRHRKDINRLIVDAKIGGLIRGPITRDSFFVRVDGKIVGFASMEFIGEQAAILQSISVEREYRHHGIGSALIEHRINLAKRRGVRTIAFVTMYYHFNFYKRRGFKTCPRKNLPDFLQNYPQFAAQRYKKCAVMVGVFN